MQVAGRRMAEEHLATRLVLQECQTSHFPDHDHPQSLFVALQRQKNPLRRQVSSFSLNYYMHCFGTMAAANTLQQYIPVALDWCRFCVYSVCVVMDLPYNQLYWRRLFFPFLFLSEQRRRLTLTLSCSMNFALYPHDTQECKIQIESRKSIFSP